METIVWLVVCSFAAFRVSEMLVLDDGPFGIFVDLRGWFNAAPDDTKSIRRTIADGLTCVHCVGIWAAFPLAFLAQPSNPFEFVAFWLAIAGIQSILSGNLGRSK